MSAIVWVAKKSVTKLLKLFLLVGNTTAAPSPNFCSVLGLKCGYDDECRPILENYLNGCAFLFTGSPHGCTAQCHSTVTAFQEYRPDSRNCVCGADSSCTVNEPRVQLCIDDGPGKEPGVRF